MGRTIMAEFPSSRQDPKEEPSRPSLASGSGFADTTEPDRLFLERAGEEPFRFDGEVARVFDDMIARSVPLYDDVQRLIPVLARRLSHRPLRVIDLGCSTGRSLISILQAMPDERLELIGVDLSPEMLDQSRRRLERLGAGDRVEWVEADLVDYPIRSASLVLMNYTLQFVPIDERPAILDRIRRGLRSEGWLVLSEKVCQVDPELDPVWVELYFDFKRRQGYSELEIARKREALENILVPNTVETNRAMLAQAGFGEIHLVLKWFNFATFIARP